MNSKNLNRFISVVAIVALVRLWTTGGGLWWATFVLLLLNAFIGAVAGKAVQIESKEFVVRFWRRAQLFMNSACFTVSFAGILSSFR